MSSENDETQIPGAVPTEAGQAGPTQDHSSAESSIPIDDTVIGGTTAADEPAQEAPVVAAPPAPVIDDLPFEDEQEELDDEGKPRKKDNPSLYGGYRWPTEPNPHVAPISPMFREATAEERDDPFYIASIPCDVETFNTMLEAYPSIDYNVGKPNREWATVIGAGSRLLMQGGFFTKALNRDGSLWAQRVPYGTGTIGATRPRLQQAMEGESVISGDLAAQRVREHLGLGASTNVPLWHSGFWVTVRAPSTAARLELQQRLAQEKIQLGRDTSGMAFSNLSIYMKSYLVDFALAHAQSANVRYNAPLDLKDKILSTDIPQLLWGLLTTLYPYGYPYHQPCINDPSKCQHVVKDVLDLNKISFTDIPRLTQAQLEHMSKRSTRMEDLQLAKYQEDHSYIAGANGLIELQTKHGKIKLQLKVPTITEYASAGIEWVDGIVNSIQQAFAATVQGEQRNAFIMDRAKALSMGEYSHWVKEIGFEDNVTIKDLDTIRRTLAEISGDPELTESFFTKVTAFIESCSISIVALTRYDCPVCGTSSVNAKDAKHAHLNAIDIEQLFFTTLDQHIAKALS
jgi:hypothetical protein